MVISWRPQHDVHKERRPGPDFLAFDGNRVIGRIFRIGHGEGGGRWYWTIMATGTCAPVVPPNGVEARQADAQTRLALAYERLMAREPMPHDAAP